MAAPEKIVDLCDGMYIEITATLIAHLMRFANQILSG